MIIVPAWIKEDIPEGIKAVLGSEPPEGAEAEWIPRGSIKNCLYAPMDFEGRKMAMLVFEEGKAPESVRAIIGNNK
jgi:hypothetical protein